MIKRSEHEKELANKFESDSLQAHSLAPGIIKNRIDLEDSTDSYSFMCSVGIRKALEKNFGKSNCSVSGKERMAKFFAFTYKEEIVFCVSELGNIGTRWYWVKSQEEGTRFGNAMLLSYDDEIKDFWPDFCYEFKTLLEDKAE